MNPQTADKLNSLNTELTVKSLLSATTGCYLVYWTSESNILHFYHADMRVLKCLTAPSIAAPRSASQIKMQEREDVD